jgi:DNA-binding CsgD family transcriptional regulator
MGLIIMRINFFPCFGPALSSLGMPYIFYSYLFIAAHSGGLFYGSYLYYAKPDFKYLSVVNNFGPFVVAFLSLYFYYYGLFNSSLSGVVFIIMAFTSGLIVSRWMVWFSTERNRDKRGAIFGSAVFITFTLLAFKAFIIVNIANGLLITLSFSAMAFLVGGLLMAKLTVPAYGKRPFSFKELFPPLNLILFGLLAYGAVSLFYNAMFINQAKYPAPPWLLIGPYLVIGLLLARLSDRLDRFFLAVCGFLFSGIGFLIYAGGGTGALVDILTSLLMLSGLICIHFYYWLSLVDHQKFEYAPFKFITGITLELVVVAIGIATAPLLSKASELKVEAIGIAGAVFIFLGLTVISLSIYSHARKLAGEVGLSSGRKYPEAHNNNDHDEATPAYVKIGKVKQEVLEAILNSRFKLTDREAEIAMLIFTGYKNSYITEKLYISPNTLKFHLKNVLSKVGAPNREQAAEIIMKAIELDQSPQ